MTNADKGVAYDIIEAKSPRDMGRVLIQEGKYAGITLAFGNLKFQEDERTPKVSYVYEVYDNPLNLSLDNDSEFKKIMDAILDDILEKSFLRGS